MLDPDLAALLEGFPVAIAVPIWWGDQDALGHVNNTAYFRLFESARIAYTTRVGLSPLRRQHDRIGPILAAIACNFRRQVVFPDTVHVGARVSRIGRSSLAMDHLVVSASQRVVVADGTSTLVVFDYDANHSEPVPDAMRRQIEAIEGRTF